MARLADIERSRGGAPGRAGDRRHAADALERPRAQCRDDRRQPRAWRSAYGFAAGADGAWARRCASSGPGGERDDRGRGLFTGYMTTVLGNDELITTLHVPPQAGRRAAYVKVTARSADDWPALGVAVSVGVGERMFAMRVSQSAQQQRQRGDFRGPRRCLPASVLDEHADARGEPGCRRRGAGGRRPARLGCVQDVCWSRCIWRAAPGFSRKPSHDRRGAHVLRPGRPLGAAARGARQGHRPLPNTSIICVCPACCTARSAAAPYRMPASVASIPRRRSACRACTRRHRRRHPHGHSQSPITARPSTTSRSSPTARCAYVGEPVAVVLAADPHIAEEAAQSDRQSITKSCPRSSMRSRR